MRISRRDFIKITGVAGFSSLAASICLGNEVSKKPMNILFIAVDDLKPLLGCYGDSRIKSPNIDRIAKSGLVALNNHCQQAVCGPSRASLLTGLRPDTTKVWDLKTRMRDVNPDVLTLPQYFTQQGYATVGMGKIFDYRCCDGRKTQDKASWSRPFVHVEDPGYALDRTKVPAAQQKPSTECADVSDNVYHDGILADTAVKHLQELAGQSKPFFLAVGFKKPHLPFVAPQKYWDLYDRKDFTVHPFQQHSKNGPELAYHNFSELRNGYSDIAAEGDLSVEKQLELIHGYHASVSFMDAQVGKLLDALEQQKLSDNTIIILWGDHGWHLGDHKLWCKHTNFEQATRSPLIISSPRRRAKGKTESPTEFVDIFPTLCDLAGLSIPDHLPGVSLKPLFEDPQKMVKPAAMSQFHRGTGIMGYAFRDRRYRYIVWQKKEFMKGQTTGPVIAEELYDYKTDPMETVNVVNDPVYQQVIKQFKQMGIYTKTIAP